MSSNSIFDQFTHQYSLNKTLKFELRPIGNTTKHIKTAGIIGATWQKNSNEIFGEDAKRAEDYKVMKEILDDVHRQFIREALLESRVKKTFNNKLLDDFYKAWEKRKENHKNYQGHQKKQAKKLGDLFNDTINDWESKYSLNKKKKGIKLLLSASIFKVLKTIIEEDQNRDDKVIEVQKRDKTPYTKDELEKSCEPFESFSTYFEGFHDNRENIYDCKNLHSTSIAYRLFEQNLPFHFKNIQKWQTITKSLNEVSSTNKKNFQKEINTLEKQVTVKLNELFKPAGFLNYFSQSGIDKYNEILGGSPAMAGTQKVQGLNEIINLTYQKNQSDRKSFPGMQQFYKQILSEDDSVFMDVFDSDEEFLNTIKMFHNKKKKLPSLLQKEIKNHLNLLEETDLKFHYLSRAKIKSLSIETCGHWNTLNFWWQKHITGKHNLSKSHQTKEYKKKLLSFKEIQDIFSYIQEENKSLITKKWQEWKLEKLIRDYINTELKALISGEVRKDQNGQKIFSIKESFDKLNKEGILNLDELSKKPKKRKEQIALIQNFLDACLSLSSFVRTLQVREKDFLKEQEQSSEGERWQEFLQTFSDQFGVMHLYNKARNWITQKPYSKDKVKVNFANPTLANGWDQNKEVDNSCVLFIKDQQYFLGVMDKKHRTLFENIDFKEIKNQITTYRELILKDEELLNTKKEGALVYQKIKNKLEEHQKRITELKDKKTHLSSKENGNYQKMVYKLLPGANKMLPKVFFSKKNIKDYSPSKEILKIINHASHTKDGQPKSEFKKKEFNQHDMYKVIDFFKASILKHSDWKHFNFKFSRTESYNDLSDFYREVEHQGYKVTFQDVSVDYIHYCIEKGWLYFFEIYNKDFSLNKKSKGKDNLHTLYWKGLFQEKNEGKVIRLFNGKAKSQGDTIKLNGKAEIFFRPASIKYTDKQKTEGHHTESLKGKFKYPILKDRRYSEDKFFFHVPITLNYKRPNNPQNKDTNIEINKFLKKQHSKVNIIGIDRGEKNLLYYSIINQNGDIIEQDTLNSITNTHTGKAIDYHKKLDEKGKERDSARKNWFHIKNIKELKDGYLSQVVHKLSQLIIKYNAIVVLEDLNFGFKRGRFKVEKQVYQKFEKTLIDKLNYLVFKNAPKGQSGHYLKAYQLAAPFKSFEKLGKQSGILFYTTASYTSTTDPITGFLKNTHYSYTNLKDSQSFWNSFNSIQFNTKEDYFEFTYDISKVKQSGRQQKEDLEVKRKEWTVCSNVTRSYYDRDKKITHVYDLHKELVSLLKKHEISYQDGKCIKGQLAQNNNVDLHEQMARYFNAILNIRVNDGDLDYILSPVEPFFDSRYVGEIKTAKLPVDSDANGAYNIARKGICILEEIKKSEDIEKLKLGAVKKNKWQNYVQSEKVVGRSKKRCFPKNYKLRKSS